MQLGCVLKTSSLSNYQLASYSKNIETEAITYGIFRRGTGLLQLDSLYCKIISKTALGGNNFLVLQELNQKSI